MNIYPYILWFCCFVKSLLFLVPKTAVALRKQVIIHFFWSKTCPACAKEKIFLNNLVEKNPQVEIKAYEVSQSESIRFLQKPGEILKADTRWVKKSTLGVDFY